MGSISNHPNDLVKIFNKLRISGWHVLNLGDQAIHCCQEPVVQRSALPKTVVQEEKSHIQTHAFGFDSLLESSGVETVELPYLPLDAVAVNGMVEFTLWGAYQNTHPGSIGRNPHQTHGEHRYLSVSLSKEPVNLRVAA